MLCEFFGCMKEVGAYAQHAHEEKVFGICESHMLKAKGLGYRVWKKEYLSDFELAQTIRMLR